jgi:neutral ceramidase
MRRLVLLLGLLACFPAAAGAGELRVGAAAVVINPPPGTPLAGYYEPRTSTTVLDDLHSKALVLEQDGVKAAMVVCDLISLPRHTVVAARRLIEKETGIPGTHVMISATHTHTGPVLTRDSERDKLDGGASDLGRRYTDLLPELIARSVAEANRKLGPARGGAAIGKEEHLSFNRRFRMKDGTVSWNPRKLDPNIVRPAGPIDPDVHVLYFDTPQGQPLATYVNFAMHPDTTGGTVISADYPGVLSRLLAEYRGPDMVTVFANGCCGNLNHRDIQWDNRQSSPAEAKRLGTILAGAVCRTYPRLQIVPPGAIRARSEIVKLPLAPITPDDVSQARDVAQRVRDRKTTFMEKVKAFKVLDVAARHGQPLEVEVQVIALGDQVAWVSLPGEIFVELGLDLKKASPFRYTLIAELANGSIGYIPNKTAYPEGNYEVVSARCAEGSGEMLVEAAVRMLKELHR